MLYVNNNGSILAGDAPTILPGNRAYLYGDGVFESIRIINGQPLNLENHVLRLLAGARAIHMRPSASYTTDFFEAKILELCALSAISEGGRCRLSLDRISGGAYLPDANDSTYYIEVYPYEVNHFELNARGLELDIYQEIKLQKNVLSTFKTKMGLPEGCLAGTMRMQVINLAIANGIKVYECAILPQNLMAADEVFLTNAIRGINWVGGYRTKRYQNNISRKLVVLLNAYWEKATQ